MRQMLDIFLHCQYPVRLHPLNLGIPEKHRTIFQKRIGSDMSWFVVLCIPREKFYSWEFKMGAFFLFTCMCQCPHVGKFFGFFCISEGSPTCTMTAIPISAWKLMWQWKSQKPVKMIIFEHTV